MLILYTKFEYYGIIRFFELCSGQTDRQTNRRTRKRERLHGPTVNITGVRNR